MTAFFCKFVQMANHSNHIALNKSLGQVIFDMSDCYTCSFQEFIPFCSGLYYFSSFKIFKTITQA